MNPILFVTLAAAAVATAACSSPSTRWAKGGTTPEDLRYDQNACAARSESYDFVFDDRDTARTGVVGTSPDVDVRRAGSSRGDVYRECMENRGWRRERGGQTPR